LTSSSWTIKPWFLTEGKTYCYIHHTLLLGFPTSRSFTSLIIHTITTPSTSFSGAVAGDNVEEEKLPRQLGASKTSTSFSGAIAGEEEDFCDGSFSHAHPLLCFKFCFTLFLLVSYYQKPKKIRILDSFFLLVCF
jgi:hypothetical protein